MQKLKFFFFFRKILLQIHYTKIKYTSKLVFFVSFFTLFYKVQRNPSDGELTPSYDSRITAAFA